MSLALEPFFAYAKERHKIYLKRVKGDPWPWTDDPILVEYKFTNIFREHDRTTVWFRDNVRERMRNDLDVLLATVTFRMLNRVETGEAIFLQKHLSGETAFETFLRTGNTGCLKSAIKNYCGDGPYVTGAYMFKSPNGMPKLDGMLSIIKHFYNHEAHGTLRKRHTKLEDFWNVLKEVPYFGPFHSYEITTDLRHTMLLAEANDINLWANPGPGCQRGIARLQGVPTSRGTRVNKGECLKIMREILHASRYAANWPRKWQQWEMREVEHTLCEFDKYERTRLGQGRPRSRYWGE